MTTGALMLDIQGLSLSKAEAEQLKAPEVGGLILFSRNYESPEQLHRLMVSIRDLRPELLVAVDQEGGRVQRFREGFTRIPPMAVLGKNWLQDPKRAIAQAHELGWLLASELREYDIDISFAPVLDLNYGVSAVIGDRAFSEEPDAIIELGGALMSGMHEAGMAATGKHFPGHGFVQVDSHLGLPVDTRSLREIEAQDIKPFAALIKRGLDAVMPAHIQFSQVCLQPAGFSEYWLQRQLRESLHFEGVIFSDDLSMEGAAAIGSYGERAEAALKAGCDMVLVCNQPEAATEVLSYLRASEYPVSHRLALMRARPKRQLDSERLSGARALARELLETAA